MNIDKIYSDAFHQVLKAQIPAGGSMPEHYATSDAFVIIVSGEARIVFKDRDCTLRAGNTFLIPGNKQHNLQVIDDFEAYILLAPAATIELVKEKEIVN